jgi:hypothetical protein
MFYSLYCQLRSGQVIKIGNGSIVPEAEARRIVAYAFAYGFLLPSADPAVSIRRAVS